MDGTKSKIIDKRFVHFKNYDTFLREINGETDYVEDKLLYGNIKRSSIVYISDKQLIWTHGKFYPLFNLKGINDVILSQDLTLLESDGLLTALAKLQKRSDNLEGSVQDVQEWIDSIGDIVTISTDQTITGCKTFSQDTIIKQIKNTGKPVEWKNGRDAALLRTTFSGDSTQYIPLWSSKSINGSWDCGSYSANSLYFTYIADADYESGNNARTGYVRFDPFGLIEANSLYIGSGKIHGQLIEYDYHTIRLGGQNRDYCDFLEYGGVWNFYKSRSGTETLVAKISEAGISASAFVKNGGTASQFLMADGSVASKVTMTAVSHLGWTSNGADALRIPSMSALALWDGRYNAAGSNLQYCDRGRFGDIVTHGHGEYVTALGISGDNITWTRSGATNSITLPYAAESSRMRVADIRDTTMTPAAFNSRTVTAWFNQTGTPSSAWYAGITVKGWTDGYAAWQLCANSTVNTADTNLYFRIGINSSFQAWQKILTDANYASMLDGRYVNAAGDSMTGDLAVRKMHLQGGNEFNCDDKLWIAYRSTPQGVNICHADQPFTYGSAGHEVLHRGNYSNLVNALNQPLTIRCGTDAKLIFDNTDGERYTVLSFREAGAEYANITAHSEAFVFAGKPVSAPYFKADRATLCPNLNADLLDGLHLSRTPAANAVPAYDADTMLPVSAGLKMQNDKMAELSSPGWYRVFSSHSADAARASLLLFLGRNYNHTNNENYVFSISLGCGVGSAGYRPTVTQLSGRAVTQLIPKIRVLQKWNSVYHVDIYYSGTVPNGVYSFGIGPGRFAAPVAAAIPDGYTSYEFGIVPNGFRCDGIAETTDLRLSRYLFFKHPGGNTGIYLSPNPDGSLGISAHSGYSYTKSLGSIGYDGCFRITNNTAIGPRGFCVGLQLRNDNPTGHTGIELCGSNHTIGLGSHHNGHFYMWRGTDSPTSTSDKEYTLNFDGNTWDFLDATINANKFTSNLITVSSITANNVQTDRLSPPSERLIVSSKVTEFKGGLILSALQPHVISSINTGLVIQGSGSSAIELFSDMNRGAGIVISTGNNGSLFIYSVFGNSSRTPLIGMDVRNYTLHVLGDISSNQYGSLSNLIDRVNRLEQALANL